MSPGQKSFLRDVAQKIPRLFAAIAEGNVRAEFILGQRILRGRQVRLKLIAEVVDPGNNPLSTHSKPAAMPAISLDASSSSSSAVSAVISSPISPTVNPAEGSGAPSASTGATTAVLRAQ